MIVEIPDGCRDNVVQGLAEGLGFVDLPFKSALSFIGSFLKGFCKNEETWKQTMQWKLGLTWIHKV